jgi:uridine kinase
MTDFKQLFKNKLFLVWLVIKIIVACMFVWWLFIKWFLPFIDYFVNSWFHNPYDYFHGIGQNTAFPYSPVMLWLISLPYLIVASIKILWIKVFAIKSILLMADIAILRVLFKWFPVYKKKILIFYRLSPIFLFITYFYGQFDVIPTAFLLLTFYHIRDDRYFIAMILLWIWIATKTHIVLIVPFIFLYLFNKEVSIKELIKYLLVLAWTVCLLLSPYITSIWYNALVLHNTEQIKIFSLFLNYGFNNLAFFLIPWIYLVLILMFRFERRMNIDYLMVFSAIIFWLLVVLVPPQLWRYYWSIPFILYFYIKYSGIPKTNLMALYVSYFLFFLLSQKSDVMSIFGILHPKWENISLNGMMFAPEKWILVQNILFTILIITTIITVVWVYKIWFLKNKKYQDKQLLIGIWGDSWSGKSTLVSNIMWLFKENLITLVEGDDIHKWPRGDENRKKFTHLNPKSNNLHLDLIHAKILKSWDTVHRKHYDHATGKFTDPRKIHASKFLLFAWLHPFFLEHMRNVMDLKIFIKLDEQLRLHWKIVRDMQERWYTKERVQEQLKSREKDSIQYIKSQEQFADIVVSLSPFSWIKDIWNPKENIPLKLSIQLSNSYYLEPLTEALKKVTTLEIEHYINDDLTKQVFECSWTILPQEVKLVLKDIMPDYYVLTEKDPEMQSGINGIIQLFILYIKYNKLTWEA